MEIKPKVIIGMPCTDIVRARTAQAIGAAVISAGDKVVDFVIKQSCEIASARTYLVNEAIRLGGTHLLFWDSDICPVRTKLEDDPDFIGRLLAHKKPIVAGNYNKRSFPLESVSQSHHKEWQDKVKTDELYEAQFAATGFMLIDLSIFDKEWEKDGKKLPWFNFGRDSQGKLALGEDAWFCMSARDMGFDTWIDPTLKICHIGEYLY